MKRPSSESCLLSHLHFPSIYDSITIANKKLLHKTIGTLLLRSADNVATIHLLAVDQLNIYTKDAILSSEERAHIASINTTAARFAIAEFSFERGEFTGSSSQNVKKV